MRRGLLCIILYNSLPFSVMAKQLKQSKNQPRWEKREREREKKRGGREVTKRKYIIHKKIDNGSSFEPTRAYLEIGISFSKACARSISNSFWWGSRNQMAALGRKKAPSSFFLKTKKNVVYTRAHLRRLICDARVYNLWPRREACRIHGIPPWLYKL